MLSLVCVLVSPKTFGTELKAATARAFQQYVDLTEARIQGEVARPSRFLQIDALPETQEAEVRIVHSERLPDHAQGLWLIAEDRFCSDLKTLQSLAQLPSAMEDPCLDGGDRKTHS